MSSPTARTTARLGATLAGALATVLVTAGPALATGPLGPTEGENGGRGLSVGTTLLLYVGIPLALLLGTAALVWLPGVIRADRYRPAKGWSAPPVWFAGPVDPVAAVQDAQLGQITRGGASGSW